MSHSGVRRLQKKIEILQMEIFKIGDESARRGLSQVRQISLVPVYLLRYGTGYPIANAPLSLLRFNDFGAARHGGACLWKARTPRSWPCTHVVLLPWESIRKQGNSTNETRLPVLPMPSLGAARISPGGTH